MSKHRRPSENTAPPGIPERHAPTGERAGDRPLPPGSRRRDEEPIDELPRRRGDTAEVAFERHALLETAGSSDGATTSTLAGEAALIVPSPADKVRNTARAEPKRRIEDPAAEPRSTRAPQTARHNETSQPNPSTKAAPRAESTSSQVASSVGPKPSPAPLQTHRRLPPLAPGTGTDTGLQDFAGFGQNRNWSVALKGALVVALHVAVVVSLYFWLG